MPINDPALRRKRLIRLSILVVVLLSIGGGVYTLFQINRTDQIVITDEQLIAEAQTAFDEGDYPVVVDRLENPRNGDNTIAAIEEDPALLRIYITARQNIPMFDDRHITRTIAPLTKLIALKPDDRDSQNELLDALLQVERYDEAIKHAQKLTKRYPDDASVLRKLGKAQLEKNQREAALSTLYRAADLEPLYVQTYVELLDILRAYDEPIDPIRERATKVYNAYPDDPRAMMIQAIIFEANGDGVQARDLLKRASEIAPTDQASVTLLASWLDRLGMYTLAASYLQEHAADGIDTPAGRMAVYRAFENADYANVLNRVTDSDPTRANSDLVAMWASALQKQGETERFDELLQLLEERNSIVATAWSKVLRLDQQDDVTPRMLIDTIVKALAADGNERASSLMKQHPYFAQRLGEAYLDALEYEAAYGAFVVAARNSRTWARPHRSLAQTLLKLDQDSAALFHAREAQRREDNPVSRQWIILGMVAVANPEKPAEIEQTLSETDKLAPDSPEAARVLPAVIDLLARANRIEQAKQRMTDALAMPGPLPVQLLESLAQLAQQNDLDLMQAIAKTLESQHGKTRGLALIQAATAAEVNGFDAGLKVITNAAPDPITKPWQTAIAGYKITNTAYDPTDVLINLANAYPTDITLQLSALQASDPGEHPVFFENAIQRLREQAGDASIHWRLHQARLRAQNPGNTQVLQQAIDDLSDAERLAPVHMELQLSLARCHMLLGQNEDAVEHAQAAKRIDATDPKAMMLYGRALYRLNRYEEARIDLIPLAQDERVDPEMRLDASKMLFEKGERQIVREAIESMRTAGQATNEALVLLAGIYAEESQFAKADEICATLLQQPDAQSIRFVANYYRQTHRPQLADQMLQTAELTNVSEADRLMIRAEDAAMRGESEQALSMILESAQAQPNNHTRWFNAVQLALSLSEPAEALRFAKLAQKHLPSDTGLASLLKNEQMVMQIRDDQALIPMTVAILSDKTYRPPATAALKISAKDATPQQIANELADLAQQHDDFKHLNELALDRLLRAGLNERAHNMAPAAMARFLDSAASARVATLAAYRMDDWAMLLSAAKAWAQRNPGDRPQADLLSAAATNALERYPATIQSLAPYVRSQQEVTVGNQLLFDLYTCALVRNGETDEAWQTLGSYAATSSEARAIAIKRVSEDVGNAQTAAVWLDQLGANENDMASLFQSAMAAFMAGQRLGNRPLVERAEQTIARILDTAGTPGVDVIYAQGQIAQYLNDLDKAEASYRKVLDSLPDNPFVLNNLSVVLIERGGNSLGEAQQLATRATQLSNNDPNLLDTLATVYLRLNKLDKAQQTIDKAIKMDNNNPAWRLTKADILEAQGETDRAAEMRERYRQRD